MGADPHLSGPDWTRAELTRLKAARFRPGAWVRFTINAFARSTQDALRVPRARREAILISAIGFAGWGLMLLVTPAAVWGLGWWAFVAIMVLTHLGMLDTEDEPDRGLGLPNLLSLARAWILPILIPAAGSAVAFVGILLAALATDGLDGRIARHTGRETRLGKQLDHATDYVIGSLAGVLAADQGWLPTWVAVLIVLRFAVPVVLLLVSYFWRADLPPAELMTSDRPAGILGAAGVILSPFDPFRAISVVLILASVALFIAGLIRRPAARPAAS